MGGIGFQVRVDDISMRHAYDKAYKSAEEEHGSDPYNGTISTTHSILDVTSKFKNSGKTLDDFIRNFDMNKGECYGICLKEPKLNTQKIRSQVKHNIEKGTKKWLLKYVIYQEWGDGRAINSYDSKGEAVKQARILSEKNRTSYEVRMEKVLEKGSNLVANIHYKKGNEKLGEYILFGVACC